VREIGFIFFIKKLTLFNSDMLNKNRVAQEDLLRATLNYLAERQE
jgi:hypothetical protein